MSTPKPRITIVGLGLIGSSIGLRLREAGAASLVVGHDKQQSAAEQAKKLGAVDKTHWNLISACEDSDLIVLAIPLGAVEPTLQAIGPDLKSGALVMDTASIKVPVLSWAAEALPEGIHFVGGNPILTTPVAEPGGTTAARGNLFENGLFCLTPAPSVDEGAVKLATGLVSLLGARPLFFDPAEHDGLVAGMEQLPGLLSLALLEMASGQATWRELRKVAGTSFYRSTQPSESDVEALVAGWMANRDNVVRWIDAFFGSLAAIRQALVDQDAEALAARLAGAQAERTKWLQDRASGDWGDGLRQELPERPSLMESFLGALWPRPRKKD